MAKYVRLTFVEREEISRLLAAGYTLQQNFKNTRQISRYNFT